MIAAVLDQLQGLSDIEAAVGPAVGVAGKGGSGTQRQRADTEAAGEGRAHFGAPKVSMTTKVPSPMATMIATATP